jgi:hypothetical protein
MLNNANIIDEPIFLNILTFWLSWYQEIFLGVDKYFYQFESFIFFSILCY